VTCILLLIVIFCVEIVPQTTRPSCVTTNDTPRTATTVPFASIQPNALLAGRQASSGDELSRQVAGGNTVGHCSTTVGQTAPDQKQTPCLLPADNFGLFSVYTCLYR